MTMCKCVPCVKRRKADGMNEDIGDMIDCVAVAEEKYGPDDDRVQFGLAAIALMVEDQRKLYAEASAAERALQANERRFARPEHHHQHTIRRAATARQQGA